MLVPVTRGTYDPNQPLLNDYQKFIYKVTVTGIITDSVIIEIESTYTSSSIHLVPYNDQLFFWSTIDDTSEVIHPGLRYGYLSEDLEMTNELYIECGPGDGVFELYDGFGRTVISQDYSMGFLVFNTSGLAKGMYYYRIIAGKKNIYSGLWMKISD